MRSIDADVTGSAPAPRSETAERRRIVEGIRYCVLVFVAVRLGLFLIGLIAPGLFPPLDPVSVPGWPARALPDPGWHNAVTAWERFDALWFLRIADAGYATGDGSAAFFPLYPLAIRALALPLGGRPLAAGFLVSNAALLGAIVILYFLTSFETSERTARTTVALLCLFPTSFFLFMPYGESLFLLLAVGALWAARRDRWLLAGVAAVLAGLTRSVGLVLAAALMAEASLQRAEDRRPLAPRLAVSTLPVVGSLLYLAYWQAKAGDWLAPLHQQANWERVWSWPWSTLIEGTRSAFRYVGATNGGYWLIDWAIVVPMLAASVFALRRYRLSYVLYAWGGLLIPLSFIFEGRPLMSMPRFVLPLFPAFWALAEGADRLRIPAWALVAGCATGLGLLSVLTVNWHYIF